MAMAAAVVCARGKIEVLFIENSAYTSCISEIQLEKIDRRGGGAASIIDGSHREDGRRRAHQRKAC